MTGAALALVAALAVASVAQRGPAAPAAPPGPPPDVRLTLPPRGGGPPAPPRPPAPPPPPRGPPRAGGLPPPPQPRAVCRMPVVRGDNRVDPTFVQAPDPSLDVRFPMRRAPGEKLDCPDP